MGIKKGRISIIIPNGSRNIPNNTYTPTIITIYSHRDTSASSTIPPNVGAMPVNGTNPTKILADAVVKKIEVVCVKISLMDKVKCDQVSLFCKEPITMTAKALIAAAFRSSPFSSML
jgi:hypothetical protein